MKKPPVLLWLLCASLLLAGGSTALSQDPYLMQDAVIGDCGGALQDSGGEEIYMSNEDFVFTVDLGEPVNIEVTFTQEVCIEDGFDFLRVYDGATTGGLLLAEVTGTDFTPAPVLANSGAVTFHFTSDNSANYCGFALEWEADIPSPEPPVLIFEPEGCPASGLTWVIDPPVVCDDIELENWVLDSGSDFLGAAEAVCEGDSATHIFLPFTEEAPGNCTWSGWIPIGVRDVCDSLWMFDVAASADYFECPLSATWVPSVDTVCAGECMTVTLEIDGCLDATVNWLQTGGGTVGAGAEHTVALCPQTTTTLMVQVTQPATGLSEVFSYSIVPVVVDVVDVLPEELCSSVGSVQLEGDPAGGTWSVETGQPDVWEEGGIWYWNPAGADGTVNLTYSTPEGCSALETVEVQPIGAGEDMTVCLDPTTDEASVNLAPTPALGGMWTGPAVFPTNTTAVLTGEGFFELVYTAGGCSDTTEIEVILTPDQLDLGSICQSEPPFSLPPPNALGGFWSGPGMNPEIAGEIVPEELDAGAAQWVYWLTGCAQVANAEILPINIGWGGTASCPTEDPYIPYPNFSPTGGTWSGLGIIDATTGLYDPGLVPEMWNNDLIYVAPNGCQDTISGNNQFTYITLEHWDLCASMDSIEMHDSGVGSWPWTGVWSGDWPGGDPAEESVGWYLEGWSHWWLDPSDVPPGTYTMTYDANSCSDSMTVTVFPDSLNLDPLLACSTGDPVELAPDNLPLGGFWNGVGVDVITGLFDPGATEPGIQTVLWTAPEGCSGDIEVEVEAWEAAGFVDLDSVMCSTHDPWVPVLLPGTTDQSWLLDGLPEDTIVWATMAADTFELVTVWNGQVCSSTDTQYVALLPPVDVSLSLSDTLLCAGVALTGQAVAWGGLDTNFTYAWTPDGANQSETTLVPGSSSWIQVNVDDGCSDTATDSAWVEVIVPPELAWDTGDTACFLEPSAILLYLTGASSGGGFSFSWNEAITGPTETALDSLTYNLGGTAGLPNTWSVLDTEAGCTTSGEFTIPSWAPVSAAAIVNPSLDCIPWTSLPVQFIDLSQYALDGMWETEGWTESYIPGANFFWTPTMPGTYDVQLNVTGEGGCPSSAAFTVCIYPPMDWFMADQFSPNDDGLNDRLVVRGEAISEGTMEVFNRWGERISLIEDLGQGWDGMQRGVPAPSGVYVVRLGLGFEDGTFTTIHRHVVLLK